VLLGNQHSTETVVVIAIAISAIESEQTSIRAIVPPATAFEEWIAVTRKVRIVTI
jgi:hypothetical protein